MRVGQENAALELMGLGSLCGTARYGKHRQREFPKLEILSCVTGKGILKIMGLWAEYATDCKGKHQPHIINVSLRKEIYLKYFY